VPHFGNDGAVLGCFTIVSDLTEYRNREQQLQQAQKMEAVGQMTGGGGPRFQQYPDGHPGKSGVSEREGKCG
jgi:hypothetical protein